MKRPSRHIALLLGVILALALTGCANYLRPFQERPAHPGLESQRHDELTELPPPNEKVVVGVYRFRDQTGQYKASNQGISYSTAVTQGATSILIRALEDSGWFTPIEREGLSNLMNERQIIQSVRSRHKGKDGQSLGQLPPLLYAGILLEGGVIGYDTNVLTGGAGARYFGAGASGKFRQDQVTIYLRAVSTQSGRVLKTVHATKTIISQQLDGNLFRFVSPSRLVEAETGYSYNEPTVLAVTEAIDEAVRSLVIEGVKSDIWALDDPGDINSAAFDNYERSLETAAHRDYAGRSLMPKPRPGLALGVSGGGMRYEGDYRDPLVRPGGSVYLRGHLGEGFMLGVSGSAGEIAADSAFSTPHGAADLHALYYALPRASFSPFVELGAGALLQSGSDLEDAFPYLMAGVGVEYLASPHVGLSLALSNRYPLREGLDGVPRGRIHDNLWTLEVGLTFYTGLFD